MWHVHKTNRICLTYWVIFLYLELSKRLAGKQRFDDDIMLVVLVVFCKQHSYHDRKSAKKQQSQAGATRLDGLPGCSPPWNM